MANEKNTFKKSPLSSQIDLSKFELATEAEKAQQDVMSESTTFFKDGMRKLMKNPFAVGSIIVLLLILATTIVAPMVVPYGYEEMISVNGRRDKTAKNLKPFGGSRTNRNLSTKAASFSLISWELTSSAVTTLFVLYTEHEFLLLSVFLPLSWYLLSDFFTEVFPVMRGGRSTLS